MSEMDMSGDQQPEVDERELNTTPDDDHEQDTATDVSPTEPEFDEVSTPEPTTQEYAGAYKPNPGISETLPVTEAGEFSKLGSLVLSNMSIGELKELLKRTYTDIAAAQKSRQQLVKENKHGGELLVADVQGRAVYITHKERDVIQLAKVYEESLRTGPGSEALSSEEEGWDNLPKHAGQPIAIGRLNHDNSKDPIVKIRGRLGLSVPGGAVLWGSGMHLTLNSPGVIEQLRLETTILMEKVERSRESMGYALASSAVYMYEPVIDFILKNVESSNIRTTDRETLLRTIAITDLEPLVLAQAAVIFPEGYNLERPCLTSKGGCGHVVKRKIHPRRMLFVRDRRFTEAQKALMSRRSSQNDIQTVLDYQQSLRPDVSRYLPLKSGLYLKLRVPSLADYLRISTAWVDRMEQRAREVASSNAAEEERMLFLNRANNVATLMLFGHWVEAFVELDPDNPGGDYTVLYSRSTNPSDQSETVFERDEKVDGLLEDLSGDSEQLDEIIKGIEKFISDMSLTAVCVPKSVCPQCGNPLTGDEESTHPHLVPINPVELFFTLLHHKILIAGG